ncbi:MAG: Ig-like domain-containing protein [Clostridia bacterium]|nr:Ig-like domain-containing protein [Clostridia bacterium]
MKKSSKILSLFLAMTIVLSMVTFTLPASADNVGEVLWSEDFDGLAESPWSYSIGPGAETNAYKEADSVAVVEGKLVITKNQKAGASINTDYVRMTPSLSSVAVPESGYLVFDFDYEQSGNWINNQFSNMILRNTEGSAIVSFGFGDATRGFRLIPGNKSQYDSDTNENIAPASVFVGKTVSVRVIFDIEESTYQVFYTPEGGETVAAFEPVSIPTVGAGTLASGIFDFKDIMFTIACDNGTENDGDSIAMTFDNFAMTVYDVNPEVEPDVPEIVSTTIAETGMGLTEPLKVLFDTTMRFGTLGGVKLYKDSLSGTEVALTPSISTDKLATYFSHAPLEYGTTYYLVIPNTVKSTTSGTFPGQTIEFTTIDRTTHHDNVVWVEDFDSRTDWNSTEAKAGWGMLMHEYVNGEDVGISGLDNMGDRDNIKRAKVEFREGGVMFTRPQNYSGTAGNNYANLTVPFSGYPGSEARYVAVEFDYYQSRAYGSKYSGDVSIKNSADKAIFKLNFGSSSYGFQYHTHYGLYISNYTEIPEFAEYLTSIDRNSNGVINADEIPKNSISGDSSTWIGKPVKVQVLFDTVDKKYIVNYTSDGVRYVARNGWEDMVSSHNLDFAAITFTSACNPANADEVITKYDNIAIVEYNDPAVLKTSADARTNVEVDEPVTITFTEAIMENTISGITLTGDSTAVSSYNLSADGKTVTLNRGDLEYGTTYTLTVPTSVMSEDYFTVAEQEVITFTTMEENAAPEVKDITIEDGATEVALDETLSVTFTKPMSSSSLANATLTADGNPVAIGVSMSNNDKTVTFTHDNFDYGKTYVLTIPVSVTDKGSNAFAGAEYTFYSKTAPTAPVIMSSTITDGQTGVPVTSDFVFVFDKAIKESTFEYITLKKIEAETETDVTRYLYTSNGNKTVTVGHNKLESGTQYKLTIPATVTAVNNLTFAGAEYTFTTANVVEGETLLYGQYFDNYIGAGVVSRQAEYSDGKWNIYSKVAGETAATDTNNVDFVGGKMVITKEQRISGTNAQNGIYATLDLTNEGMPETGVVAVEYDINYSKKTSALNYYTDAFVSTSTGGNENYQITRLSFASGGYGWKDKSVYNDVNKDLTITSNAWLEGKDIHVKLVYNLDDRTYSMFYTVDGVTYQSPVGVAPFRDNVTGTRIAKIAFQYTYAYADADPIIITIDNVEVKKLTKPEIDTDTSFVVEGKTGVSATEAIKMVFKTDMDTKYFKDIKIYEGSVAPENLVPTTSVFEDAKNCLIYLDNGLKYSTGYVMDIPASILSANLIPITAQQFNFTTEEPQASYSAQFLSVTNVQGTEVADITDLSYVKATVRFTNSLRAFAKQPKLVVALCNSEGKIKSISYCERIVLVGGNQDVTVSFTSATPFEDGDCLKAYVLDGTTGRLLSSEVIY